MPDGTIVVDHLNDIGVITLNRPEQFNTFSREMATQLRQGLMALDQDKAIRVVVVKGAGKAFCTGIDLSEFLGISSHQEYRRWLSLTLDVFQLIAEMRKPVLASAHGYALAFGGGLIAACDLAIVSKGTKIGVHAVNVGLFCMGPAVPLSRSLGRKRCMEMLMTGDLVDADVAEKWGLVNRVVPEDQLETATMALARKLAGKSPLAIQMGKKAYYGMSDMEFGKALAYSNERLASLCVTEDAQEGVKAFLEKRDPVWKER